MFRYEIVFNGLFLIVLTKLTIHQLLHIFNINRVGRVVFFKEYEKVIVLYKQHERCYRVIIVFLMLHVFYRDWCLSMLIYFFFSASKKLFNHFIFECLFSQYHPTLKVFLTHLNMWFCWLRGYLLIKSLEHLFGACVHNKRSRFFKL